jgi:DNA-directed RNA polymerase subunit K/omega
VVQRPAELSSFEFAVLAGLRAGQLARGCTPRVKSSDKIAVTAQMEVAERPLARDPTVGVGGGESLDVVAGRAMRLDRWLLTLDALWRDEVQRKPSCLGPIR